NGPDLTADLESGFRPEVVGLQFQEASAGRAARAARANPELPVLIQKHGFHEPVGEAVGGTKLLHGAIPPMVQGASAITNPQPALSVLADGLHGFALGCLQHVESLP